MGVNGWLLVFTRSVLVESGVERNYEKVHRCSRAISAEESFACNEQEYNCAVASGADQVCPCRALVVVTPYRSVRHEQEGSNRARSIGL